MTAMMRVRSSLCSAEMWKLCEYPQSRALSAREDKTVCSGDNSAWSEAWQYSAEAQQYTEICELKRTACKNDHCA